MPNKVRFVIDIEGRKYAGGRAKAILMASVEKYLTPFLKPEDYPEGFKKWPWWERARWYMDRLSYARKGMWVFREPSRVHVKNSRYMHFARKYRLNVPLKRRERDDNSVAATPTPPPGRERFTWDLDSVPIRTIRYYESSLTPYSGNVASQASVEE